MTRNRDGRTKTKLYTVWRGMKERCTNPAHKNYNLYKGKLCLEWYDPINFITWARNKDYKEGLTIDRIDPNKGYDQENCRFITKKENTIKGNKERKLTQIEYNGIYYTKKELSKLLGLKYTTLIYRLNMGVKIDSLLKGSK
jgi:hypothetical protein